MVDDRKCVYVVVEKIPTGIYNEFAKLIIGVFTEDEADIAEALSQSVNRSKIKLPLNTLLEEGIIL